MPKEFIMRGQTAVAAPTEVLNITGYRPGYGYVIKEFELYPSTNIGASTWEMCASISATQNAIPPDSPDFNEDGLIATAFSDGINSVTNPHSRHTIINDLFIITQDLILMVADTYSNPVNWHVRFREVKLTGPAEAVANYKQYTIYNTSS